MDVVRKIFLTLGSIFALLLIIVGVGGYLVTGPAPTAAQVPTVPVSDGAAASLDEKFEEFQRQIEQAYPGEELTLVLTEEEVTSKVTELAENGRLPVDMQDPQIHFGDGMVEAYAMVDLLIDMQVAFQARIDINDGKPKVTVESLYFGRLPIAATFIDNVMVALVRQMEDRLESLPIVLREIAFEDGEVTISGIKR